MIWMLVISSYTYLPAQSLVVQRTLRSGRALPWPCPAPCCLGGTPAAGGCLWRRRGRRGASPGCSSACRMAPCRSGCWWGTPPASTQVGDYDCLPRRKLDGGILHCIDIELYWKWFRKNPERLSHDDSILSWYYASGVSVMFWLLTVNMQYANTEICQLVPTVNI